MLTSGTAPGDFKQATTSNVFCAAAAPLEMPRSHSFTPDRFRIDYARDVLLTPKRVKPAQFRVGRHVAVQRGHNHQILVAGVPREDEHHGAKYAGCAGRHAGQRCFAVRKRKAESAPDSGLFGGHFDNSTVETHAVEDGVALASRRVHRNAAVCVASDPVSVNELASLPSGTQAVLPAVTPSFAVTMIRAGAPAVSHLAHVDAFRCHSLRVVALAIGAVVGSCSAYCVFLALEG